jgi:hypothetical protein
VKVNNGAYQAWLFVFLGIVLGGASVYLWTHASGKNDPGNVIDQVHTDRGNLEDTVDDLGDSLEQIGGGIDRIEGRNIRIEESIRDSQEATGGLRDSVESLGAVNRDFREFLDRS